MKLIIETDDLSYSRGLQARAIHAQQGPFKTWSVQEIAEGFVKEFPQYNDVSILGSVKLLVQGRGFNDETMLQCFESFCSKVKSGELNEAA